MKSTDRGGSPSPRGLRRFFPGGNPSGPPIYTAPDTDGPARLPQRAGARRLDSKPGAGYMPAVTAAGWIPGRARTVTSTHTARPGQSGVGASTALPTNL